MKKGFDRNRFEIELLSRQYLNSKRIIRESGERIKGCSSRALDMHMRIVYHMEYVAECLDESDRFIIENEVMKGKKGKWYLECYSSTSYYRHRKKAYENFLRCL